MLHLKIANRVPPPRRVNSLSPRRASDHTRRQFGFDVEDDTVQRLEKRRNVIANHSPGSTSMPAVDCFALGRWSGRRARTTTAARLSPQDALRRADT